MLLDLVFPRRCVVCGSNGAVLCFDCEQGLERLGKPMCERCGAPTAWPVERCRECAGRRIAFARARAAIAYDASAKRLVGAWKERGQRKLAEVAAELVARAVERPSAYTLTFVPADENRLLERGHNPAERLAAALGARWQLPVVPLLSRAPGRAPQKGLTLAERRRNVRGAFAPSGSVPNTIVLVDDVYTSGATVSAAATALRKGGARRVEVVTFARAVR
ncbi:MAG: ComF family protein [Actinobacteria bacterium]|nr:MAG: ComF family protein [Actinomycetota bacterium]